MSAVSQPTFDSCLKFAESIGLASASNGSNFVFSPLSIYAALSLAAIGSQGSTLDQFIAFLGSPTVEDLIVVMNSVLESVRTSTAPGCKEENGGSHLSFVNGIWVDESMILKPSFRERAVSLYNAEAKRVDFQNKALEAAEEVNLWVESKTKGLIKNLIPHGALNHLTRVVLANALYFKGTWAQTFTAALTINARFHLLDGSSIQVPFMMSKFDQFIASFNGFKVLKLPYKPNQAGRKFSMLVFLPENKDGLSDLLHNAVSCPNFFNSHVPIRRVNVGRFMIPRFKISTGFEASKALQDLGLVIPFTTEAEFTEMVLPSKPARHLEAINIASVYHKATIEVAEEGTIASAATVVIMEAQCARHPPPQDFVADHPFMFVIREEESGALLFLGHVVNPL